MKENPRTCSICIRTSELTFKCEHRSNAIRDYIALVVALASMFVALSSLGLFWVRHNLEYRDFEYTVVAGDLFVSVDDDWLMRLFHSGTARLRPDQYELIAVSCTPHVHAGSSPEIRIRETFTLTEWIDIERDFIVYDFGITVHRICGHDIPHVVDVEVVIDHSHRRIKTTWPKAH